MLGSYQLVLYIIFIMFAFIVFIDYDLYVARVMKQVKKEIKAGTVLEMKKKNRLGFESAAFAIILIVSVALSALSLFGGEMLANKIANVVSIFSYVNIVASVPGIVILSALAIKFLLVNRCNADFMAREK